MTPRALRKLALSLEGTTEAPHFDRTAFRRRTIFATMTGDGKEAMVKVSSPDLVRELLETRPEVFFSYGKWTTGMGALGVRLAKVDAALMGELLEQAWRDAGPKPRKRR